ncbi:MAG: hypothetical protein WDW36_002691 [Sanguina aurantia]
MVQGTRNLDIGSPVWLLGVGYGFQGGAPASDCLSEEVLIAFHADFSSRVWCTYRRDFLPFVGSTLTSDVGWGCTFRSGQMLMAEALSRSMFGRAWTKSGPTLEPEVLGLLAMLADNERALLSLHNLCAAGQEYGVVAGKWLGPWVLCKTLAALVNSTRPNGLQVHVVHANNHSRLQRSSSSSSSTGTSSRPPTSSFPHSAPSPTATPSPRPPTAAVTAPNSSSELERTASHGDDIQNGYSHCSAGQWAQPPSLHPSAPISITTKHTQSHTPQHDSTTAEGEAVGPAPTRICEVGSWSHVGSTPAVGCLPSYPDATSTQHPVGKGHQVAQGLLSPAQTEAHEQRQGPIDVPAPPAVSEGQGRGSLHLAHGAAVSERPAGGTETAAVHHTSPSKHHSNGASYQRHASDSSGDSWHDMRTASDASCDPGLAGVDESQSFPAEAVAGPPGQGQSQSSSRRVPLLLLLPLTLGVDKMNPVYHPQLAAALTFPQSVGIVGGRPGASLYFVGTQDDHLLFLDPHEARPCATLPDHARTYFCDTARLMPIAAMDASLALGFLVDGLDDFADLESRLRELSRVHRVAPLVTLASSTLGSAKHALHRAGDTDPCRKSRAAVGITQGSACDQSEDWEMV